ncbi:LysM peptidoglycan-binding domain-containing protein, partial [Carnobacterium sp.]|uniref:LysM peptidoglycan-binding domain-containing protein n=1 Tax=Carnobacterium sp. TaxID=48221 RepID=UPI0028AC647B
MKARNILLTLSSACLLSILVTKDVVMADKEINTGAVHIEMVNGGYALPINELYIDNNISGENHSQQIEDVFKEMYLKQTDEGKFVLYGSVPDNMDLLLVDEASSESVKLAIDDKGYFEVEYDKIAEYKAIKLVEIDDSDVEDSLDELSIDINQLDGLLQGLEEAQKEISAVPESKESKQEEPEQKESEPEEPEQEESIPNKKSESAEKNEEPIESPKTKEKSTASSKSVMTAPAKRTANNGIYTIVKGDNFNAIAKDFNLSSIQLKVWNSSITDINNIKVGQNIVVSRKGYESTLSKAEKAKLSVATTSLFTTKQQF